MNVVDGMMKQIQNLSITEWEELKERWFSETKKYGTTTLERFTRENRFSDGRVCPICGCFHIVRNGHRKDGKQKYICKDCGKNFVVIGKKNNQNFVSIPYDMLIKMITYKAELQGIVVTITDEKYTSGTSYLDGEEPTKENYKKARRKHRGLFVSNRGISINADVNGSYQIMKKVGIIPLIKPKEKVVRLKVA